MRLEHVLIGIAVFLLIFTLGYNIYVNQIDEYNLIDESSGFQDISNNVSLNNQIDRMKDNTQGQDVSTEDSESSLYKRNTPAIKDITNSIPIINNLFNNINKKTGLIPEFVTNSLIWIISILGFVFIIYMFARFKPQD